MCLHDRRVVHASCVGGDMAGRSGVEAAVEACRGTDKNEFVFHQESPQASPGPAQTVHTRTLCVCMQRTQHASARCTFLWKVVCMYVCTYVSTHVHMYASENTYLHSRSPTGPPPSHAPARVVVSRHALPPARRRRPRIGHRASYLHPTPRGLLVMPMRDAAPNWPAALHGEKPMSAACRSCFNPLGPLPR